MCHVNEDGQTRKRDERSHQGPGGHDGRLRGRIKSEIDISDRSRIVTFGDRAQRSVV
jgi:hypothetical protein